MTLVALPASALDPAFAPAVLSAVTSGQYEMPYADVTNTYKGHTATFRMSADALKINGVRYGMGAGLMQQVADALGCLLPTARLRDLLYMQRAITILPETSSIVGIPIASTATADMVKHSAAIDAAIEKAGGSGIVQTTGKPWILTNDLLTHPGKACNYGWNVPGTGSSWLGVYVARPASDPSLPFRVIQDPGYAHGLDQADFSETCTIVHRACIVDGAPMDLADLLVDPVLCYLASHEGPMKLLRQPGVPVFACQVPLSAPQMTEPILLTDPSGNSLCPAPSPPTDIIASSPGGNGIDWKMVGLTALAAGGVVAAFFLALKHAGRAAHPSLRLREEARARR
jgi:hypothetical protein